MSVDLPYTNPFQPPEAAVLEPPPGQDALRPVPWEDLASFPGFWKRLGGMFSLLFSRPAELLERIPVTEEIGPAWRFTMVMAVPYLLFLGLLFGVMGSLSLFVPRDPNLPKGLLAGIFGGELVLILLVMMAGMFIYGAILHASLWLWGGTRAGRGLTQTLRLCGYAWGFVHLGMLIPCFGALVGLAGLFYIATGLARIHRTDTWRGACAVLTPLMLCCLGYAVFFALAIGLSALKH